MTAKRRRPGRRRTLGLVIALLAAIGLFAVAARVRINTHSPSAPRGLYLLTAGAPERGAWVVVCLPPPIAAFGRSRGYLPAGLPPTRCADGSSEVLKRVAAVAGDRVTVAPDGLAVNGVRLPSTPLLARDSQGRPLPTPPAEGFRLRPGEVFLLSDFIPNSWDSRYYGPIDRRWVRSTARPVLVFR